MVQYSLCWTVSEIGSCHPLSLTHTIPDKMVCWVQYLSVPVLVLLRLSQLNRLHNPQTWDPCGFQASGVGAVADYTADPNPFWDLGLPDQHLFPLSALRLG